MLLHWNIQMRPNKNTNWICPQNLRRQSGIFMGKIPAQRNIAQKGFWEMVRSFTYSIETKTGNRIRWNGGDFKFQDIRRRTWRHYRRKNVFSRLSHEQKTLVQRRSRRLHSDSRNLSKNRLQLSRNPIQKAKAAIYAKNLRMPQKRKKLPRCGKFFLF